MELLGWWRVILWVFAIYLVSCGGTATVHAPAAPESHVPVKPPSSYHDTLWIGGRTAVFYAPDSIQLESIKANSSPALFESIMHDYFYLARNAHAVLKASYPSIKVIETKKARFLLFRNDHGRDTCIDLNGESEPCGLFIYDGSQPPRHTDMMNIETALGVYFKTIEK